MSNDIAKILARFNQINEGLDAQEKSVKQLPALFKPKKVSPVLNGPYGKENATQGYLVGEGDEEPTVNRGGNNKLRDKKDYHDKLDFLQRQLNNPALRDMRDQINDRIAQLQKAARMSGFINEAANSKAWEEGGREGYYHRPNKNPYEPGTQEHKDYNDGYEFHKNEKQWNEGKEHATEDVISTVKKKLGDYLQDIATQIKNDPDLKDKMPQDIDKIGPAVKTITTDDGHEIKIHGNEDDGFRVTIKNKPSQTTFESLDHAVMACEMYCARRKMVETNLDYVEERS